MPEHPSLNAPLVGPPPLRPQLSMPPYDPCWCGSGAKFKFCHFRRDAAEQVNIFEVEAKMRDLFEHGYCSHPSAAPSVCEGGITKAHTVQRRGGLGAIAEAGHVLTLKPTMNGMIEHDGKPPPRRIGVRKASVFPGFCNRHDTDVFKPVEAEDIRLEKREAFLLSYRAIAFERFAKDVQLQSLAVQRQMDKGQPFPLQVAIQQSIHPIEWGVRRGLADVNRWKDAYDRRLLSGALDDFHFVAVRFDAVLPIVACAGFHAEVDLAGNLLQRLTRGATNLEHIAMNVTAYKGATVVVLGWLGAPSGPSMDFALSFHSLPDDRKADAVVRIAFEQTDNIFMREQWWAGLGPAQQRAFIEQAWSGTPSAVRRVDCLVDRGTNHATAKVLELVTA